MDIGFTEIIIILVIVLLLFGSTRLPKLSRSFGEALRELRDGFTGVEPKAERKKPEAKQNATEVPKPKEQNHQHDGFMSGQKEARDADLSYKENKLQP